MGVFRGATCCVWGYLWWAIEVPVKVCPTETTNALSPHQWESFANSWIRIHPQAILIKALMMVFNNKESLCLCFFICLSRSRSETFSCITMWSSCLFVCLPDVPQMQRNVPVLWWRRGPAIGFMRPPLQPNMLQGRSVQLFRSSNVRWPHNLMSANLNKGSYQKFVIRFQTKSVWEGVEAHFVWKRTKSWVLIASESQQPVP